MQRVNIKGTETKALEHDEYVSAVVKDVIHELCLVPPLTARSPVHCPAPICVSLISERPVCISLLIESVLPDFSDVVLSAHLLILTCVYHILTSKHHVLVNGTALLLLLSIFI